MTTLKAARLQFFFMQLEKPFLAELRFAALLRGKPAPSFLEMRQLRTNGRNPALPP